ncbi:MAG: SH3 domain-containing protein [Lachnospiraceae bacterium]|jgi:cell wall-associated NlpC family hydrolase|nr:SH3 domain-containing protein [Lachnospiraceae bacterium]
MKGRVKTQILAAGFLLCLIGTGFRIGIYEEDRRNGVNQEELVEMRENEVLSVSNRDLWRVTAPEDYQNIAVSQVSDYVNIRQEPNTSGQVVGKIYNNCAATILQTVEGEGGNWYQIQSGNVSGYIKAQYFITGAQAEEIAREIGTEYAIIQGTALRLRAAPDLSAPVLTTLPQGAEYVMLGEANHFAHLSVDEDLEGYVSMDYITTRIEFRQAVSLEEEASKLAEEAKRKQEAEAALQNLEEIKMVEAKNDSGSGSLKPAETPKAIGDSAVTMIPEPAFGQTSQESQTIAANPFGNGNNPQVQAPITVPSSSEQPGISYGPGGNASSAMVSATRTAVVAYAKQFLGNPYVYGGSSLTQGADCSGFVMRIYEHFGIQTGRNSREQAVNGRMISINAVQPGDLLFYASGDTINHVAIYIGGGQVIHAASAKTGIIISPANYRTPCRAVTFLD